MNWLLIILVFILVICTAVFLIINNQKDKKDFEKKINSDYPKRRKHGDIETEQ